MLFRCILIGHRSVAERRNSLPFDSYVWNAFFATQPRLSILGGTWHLTELTGPLALVKRAKSVRLVLVPPLRNAETDGSI